MQQKSTIAEIVSKKYDLYYFKVDDFLDKYIKTGASKGYETFKNIESMNSEKTWMRDPLLQCAEELAFYEEIFEFVLADLEKIKAKGILTDFQISHYRKREWVPYVLEGCSDKEKLFLIG